MMRIFSKKLLVLILILLFAIFLICYITWPMPYRFWKGRTTSLSASGNLPLYSDAENAIESFIDGDGISTYSLTFMSQDSKKNIVDFYLATLAQDNWNIRGVVDKEDTNSKSTKIICYKKDIEVTIFIKSIKSQTKVFISEKLLSKNTNDEENKLPKR